MKKLNFDASDFKEVYDRSGNKVNDTIAKCWMAKEAQKVFNRWYAENIETAPTVVLRDYEYYIEEKIELPKGDLIAKLVNIKEFTTCKDCGIKTIHGPGSARCKQCWDDKCGAKKD